MAASYVVRPLSPSEASEGARAWNDLADGTLPPDTVRKIETLLAASGTGEFAAFGAEARGELCGIATARVISHPLTGKHGEIDALMIDARLPDEAGDALAHLAIEWLRERGVSSISHMRDPAAPASFWEGLGFRPDMLRYTLASQDTRGAFGLPRASKFGSAASFTETGGRPGVVGGDVAVRFGELDQPRTKGQLRVRALDPELVWLAHEHEPWQPRTV